jgi:tryptophan-rich sensory protein
MAVLTAPVRRRVSPHADAIAARLARPGPGFHATWSVAVATQLVGAWLAWRADAERGEYDIPAFLAYAGQATMGIAWALLFFGLRRPALALVAVCTLWVAVAVSIIEFARRHRYVALLLFPYAVWVGYAALVNAAAWWTDRPRG